MHTAPNIAHLEQQLFFAREQHDTALRAAAEHAERAEAERKAAADAQEARLIKEWQANWKYTRLRCIVPPSCTTTHFVLSGARRWVDHRGAEHNGPETVPVLLDGDDRVVWLRDFNDYDALVRGGGQGAAFERVNAALNQKRAAACRPNATLVG